MCSHTASKFIISGVTLGFRALVCFGNPSDPLPPAPETHVVTISPAAAHGNEPSIAVNPNNPSQVVAVYQGNSKAAYSTDGGKTFTLAEGTTPTDWRVAGDVSTAFDNKGHAFLCYLTFDHLGTTSYWAHGAGRNGIYVRRSPDGGKTWGKEPVAVKAFPIGKEPDIQWEDMPRIFADDAQKSPHSGNLYVGWIEWQIDKSIMLFSRSVDDGQTWSSPMRISTHAGLPRDDNGGLAGLLGTVGADGTVYVIWNDGNGIAFTESHDGGKSFAPSRSVIETAPLYFGGVPGVLRVMGFPQIGVDSRTARLYITWSDYRNGDIDVFCASSADHGRTWSQPLRVNSDPLHDGSDQFFQWMTVDPLTGAVYVQFYDRRADLANRKTTVTLARSTDHGKTFTNYTWMDVPFEGEQVFLGDYTWLTARGDRVYGVWTQAAPENAAASAPQRTHRPATVVRVGTADFSKLP
jgi:hypothetical protein